MKESTKAIILGAIATLIIGYLFYLMVSSYPATEEQVREIKFCQDNGLNAYSTDSGHWRCRPIKIK